MAAVHQKGAKYYSLMLLTTRAGRWLRDIPNFPVGELVGTPVLQPGAQGWDPDRIRGRRRNPVPDLAGAGRSFHP